MNNELMLIAKELNNELRDREWFKRVIVKEYHIVILIGENTPFWMYNTIPTEYLGHPIHIQKMRDFVHFYYRN